MQRLLLLLLIRQNRQGELMQRFAVLSYIHLHMLVLIPVHTFTAFEFISDKTLVINSCYNHFSGA